MQVWPHPLKQQSFPLGQSASPEHASTQVPIPGLGQPIQITTDPVWE